MHGLSIDHVKIPTPPPPLPSHPTSTGLWKDRGRAHNIRFHPIPRCRQISQTSVDITPHLSSCIGDFEIFYPSGIIRNLPHRTASGGVPSLKSSLPVQLLRKQGIEIQIQKSRMQFMRSWD